MTRDLRIEAAAELIDPYLSTPLEAVLVLGSGLGGLAQGIDAKAVLEYGDIPHFKAAGAPGHDGRLLLGELYGRQVAVMQGRLHAYEGHSAAEIVFPLQVLNRLGAKTLLITNAAGGINESFNVGDIMLISDHINFTGMHPITLSVDHGVDDFPDMTYAYTPALQDKAIKAAMECKINLRRGVYLGLRGPSFETPAEIRAFRTWGADAVGMSTVLEVITAAACKMEVCGLTMISNMAAGMLDQPLSGEDIMAASAIAADNMEHLVEAMLR